MTRPMPVFTETLLTPEPWMQDALCTQTDPDIFFPDKGGTALPAKTICEACDVRAECLAYALRTGQKDGVWGGMTPHERTALHIPRERACVDCGRDITDRPYRARRCGPCSNWRRGRAA